MGELMKEKRIDELCGTKRLINQWRMNWFNGARRAESTIQSTTSIPINSSTNQTFLVWLKRIVDWWLMNLLMEQEWPKAGFADSLIHKLKLLFFNQFHGVEWNWWKRSEFVMNGTALRLSPSIKDKLKKFSFLWIAGRDWRRYYNSTVVDQWIIKLP